MTSTFSRSLLAAFVAFRVFSFGGDASALVARAAAQQITSSEVLSSSDFLAETNAQRTAHNMQPLTVNPELSQAAAMKAADMVSKGYFDHFHDGKAPWDFIEGAGYNYETAGENLARGFTSTEATTDAWMKSPAHAANILSPKFKEVGYASIKTLDASGEPVIITVQMFGAR